MDRIEKQWIFFYWGKLSHFKSVAKALIYTRAIMLRLRLIRLFKINSINITRSRSQVMDAVADMVIVVCFAPNGMSTYAKMLNYPQFRISPGLSLKHQTPLYGSYDLLCAELPSMHVMNS